MLKKKQVTPGYYIVRNNPTHQQGLLVARMDENGEVCVPGNACRYTFEDFKWIKALDLGDLVKWDLINATRISKKQARDEALFRLRRASILYTDAARNPPNEMTKSALEACDKNLRNAARIYTDAARQFENGGKS